MAEGKLVRSPFLGSDRIPVLMYHGLTRASGRHEGRHARYWVDAANFAAQVRILSARGYRAMVLDNFWGTEIQAHDGATPVVLTFDDGRSSDFELALPILADSGATAVFFVNTANIGTSGYVSWEQLRAMKAAGMSIQSHAHQHVDLRRLKKSELDSQLSVSKQILEGKLGTPVKFLAIPYGLVNPRVIETAFEKGYLGVCTSTDWPAQFGKPIISRCVVYRSTTIEQFQRLLECQFMTYAIRRIRTAAMYIPKHFLLRLRPLSSEGL